MSDTALRLADALDRAPYSSPTTNDAAEELRRLVAENEALKAELIEQARVNGMGGEREARLMALNAELSEALRWCIRQMPEPVIVGTYFDGYKKARIALAKN